MVEFFLYRSKNSLQAKRVFVPIEWLTEGYSKNSKQLLFLFKKKSIKIRFLSYFSQIK
jgi:hypothetical protein